MDSRRVRRQYSSSNSSSSTWREEISSAAFGRCPGSCFKQFKSALRMGSKLRGTRAAGGTSSPDDDLCAMQCTSVHSI